MARVSVRFLSAGLLISLFLVGCKTTQKGRIYFVTNDGTITDKNFSTDYLEGVSGTPIKIELPKVVKTGYYFVGWREKDSQGNYRAITKLVAEDGSDYYYYPYGNDTLYAYFEPETTLHLRSLQGPECCLCLAQEECLGFLHGHPQRLCQQDASPASTISRRPAPSMRPSSTGIPSIR
jgi:hypothetical protein